ncbi:MAG: Uma2 family endonuclease [Chloroflexi bacterium]|nr:Uma2 family endonuclease [Chloroflexota bacterium]
MKIWPGRYDIDDVWDIVHKPENDDKRFELLDGQLVEFPLCGGLHGLIASELLFGLANTNKRDSAGIVTARSGYHPPDDRWTVLGPSAAFTRKERVQYPLAKRYAARMPDIAVEVASFCNPYDWVREKLPKYLHNGTQLVWVGLSERIGVEVCKLDEDGEIQTEFISADGSLSGEDVLPGFRLELSALFS